jgi:hypothetical protein
MTSLKIFKSKRNGEKLSFEGYTYNKRSSNEISINWWCVDRKCPGCGRSENEVFVILKEHNHDPCFLKAEKEVILSKIKSRAVETYEKPKDIVNHFLCGERQNLASELPKVRSMITRITIIRKEKDIIILKNSLSMPSLLRNTLNKEKFLFLSV